MSTLRRLACAAAFALAWVSLVATPAAAHAGFVSATPEPGSTLSTAPGLVVVDFSEPLNQELSRASVTSPDGVTTAGELTDDMQITVALSTNTQGVYDVSWTTVSVVDGHTLTGTFAFGVGVAPGPGASGETTGSPRTGDVLVSIARVIEDAALLVALGLLLLGRLARRHPPIGWVRARPAKVLAVAALAGALVVLGEALIAAPAPSVRPVVVYLTTGTTGFLRLVRPGLELAAAVLAARRSRWTAVLAGAALVALGAAGHAAAVQPRWWGIGVEALHLVSAGLWVGGILALGVQRPPAGWREGRGLELLARFTRVALPAFVVTAATGVLRGVQETGGLDGLFGTPYGTVLLLKVGLVLLMAQLSVLAWRRIVIRPRLESAIGLSVLGAAAIMASFPLPPARLAEAESGRTERQEVRAIPAEGELSLGSNAGEFLVGLTVRPSGDQMLIYVLGLEGPDDTAARVVGVEVNGRDLPVAQCGVICRSAEARLEGSEIVSVSVGGPGGGVAEFRVPDPSSPPADGVLERMLAAMEAVDSFRLEEELGSGRARARSEYLFQAPDAMKISNRSPDGSGSDIVFIGDTRYLRQLPGGSWETQTGGVPTLPVYVWESFQPFVGSRLIGRERIDGTPTRIVSFFGGDEQLPVWFKQWIDARGLVLRAEMRAPGHFMDQHYRDFGAPIMIRPPDVG